MIRCKQARERSAYELVVVVLAFGLGFGFWLLLLAGRMRWAVAESCWLRLKLKSWILSERYSVTLFLVRRGKAKSFLPLLLIDTIVFLSQRACLLSMYTFPKKANPAEQVHLSFGVRIADYAGSVE